MHYVILGMKLCSTANLQAFNTRAIGGGGGGGGGGQCNI